MEIHNVVDYLLRPERRILHLNGTVLSTDLTLIVHRASILASQRDKDHLFRDGIFYIDIGTASSISHLTNKLCEELQLPLTEQFEKIIEAIRDCSLCLVFDKVGSIVDAEPLEFR